MDQETLKRALAYDPITGVFTRILGGKDAGSVNKNGYVYITIQYKKYLAQRLAWLYVYGDWPVDDVDHIDGRRTNNAFSNLRAASRAQNLWNSKRRKTNTSGYKGVHFLRKTKLWRARITVRGQGILLGHFKTPQLAHAAYVAAATEYFGEFARAA